MWVASSRALGRRRWALRVDAGEAGSFPRKQTTKEGSSMRARAWMQRRGSWCESFATISLLLMSLLFWPAQSAAQSANTAFSGQATVVQATVAAPPPLGPQTIVLSDTGALDSTGGAKHVSLLEAEASDPNNLVTVTAEVLHASTVGQGQRSRSEASVANVTLTLGGNVISAGFLQARATAECQNGTASVSGSSEIVGLVINGQSIVVSGQPNQTISLPLDSGRVTINEQSSSASGKNGDITVNALHVEVFEVANVVISSAHADITCGGPVCPGGDFVTGGGWITGTPSGAKGTFGVAGGIKNGALWGHLTYIDHGQNGLKVKGTGVTAYTAPDLKTHPTLRRIEGTAEVNGQSGFTYQVDVSDNGEPGRSDTFSLTLSNGYSASGSLDGGNIQLHQPCKSP